MHNKTAQLSHIEPLTRSTIDINFPSEGVTNILFLELSELTSTINNPIFIENYFQLLSILYEWITKQEKQ